MVLRFSHCIANTLSSARRFIPISTRKRDHSKQGSSRKPFFRPRVLSRGCVIARKYLTERFLLSIGKIDSKNSRDRGSNLQIRDGLELDSRQNTPTPVNE